MRLIGLLCGRSLMIFRYFNWIGCYSLLVQSFINFLTTTIDISCVWVSTCYHFLIGRIV
jgi:hypothetical protein